MSDLIDRQAAIDRINKQREHLQPDIYSQDKIGDAAYMVCAEFIERLPSAQPTDADIQKMQDIEQAMLDKAYECGKQDAAQWMPCSERLPEVGQDILMSIGGMYTAEGCLREDGDWAQFRWDAIQRKNMVDAWMPLPEPYKEDDHETD